MGADGVGVGIGVGDAPGAGGVFVAGVDATPVDPPQPKFSSPSEPTRNTNPSSEIRCRAKEMNWRAFMRHREVNKIVCCSCDAMETRRSATSLWTGVLIFRCLSLLTAYPLQELTKGFSAMADFQLLLWREFRKRLA